MGSALLVPVSSTIGQAKWSWIGKGRRKLADIAVYDEASRGPWGSLVLLLKKGLREPVAFGAVITIFALPIAPLLQQTTAVVLENRPVKDSTATLLALYWWAEGVRTESTIPRVGDDMVMAINRGLFFDGDFNDPFSMSPLQSRPQCQTGNCSFGVFETLAIRSECKDISQFLTMEEGNDEQDCGYYNPFYERGCARWSLPNGYNSGWVDSSSGMLLSASASWNPILLRPGLSILNLTAVAPCWSDIHGTDGRSWWSGGDSGKPCDKTKAQAQECALQWCVRKYESSMTNGVLQENILSTTDVGEFSPGFMYDFNPPNSSVSFEVDPHASRLALGRNGSYWEMATGPMKGKLSVNRHASDLISTYLKSELEGFTAVNDTYIIRDADSKPYLRRLYTANLGEFRPGYNTRHFDMSPVFEAMALSMTSSLRTNHTKSARPGYNLTRDGYIPSDDSWDYPTIRHPVTTAPSMIVPILRVRWAWVTLPAALEALTLLLLCYMVRWNSQRRRPVWRSSALPLLLLGSEMYDAVGDNIPRHILDMEELAKGVSMEPDITMGRAQPPIENELEDGWFADEARGRKSKENASDLTLGRDMVPTPDSCKLVKSGTW